MSCFKPALEVVLKHEGGYQDGTNDPGGPTNSGISQAWLRDRGYDWDAYKIKSMTSQEISFFYLSMWNSYGCQLIDDQRVATKYFDACVNTGNTQGARLAQRACNDCGVHVICDGVFGPQTESAMNSVDPQAWLNAMADRMIDFYTSLSDNAKHPERKLWLNTWLNRAKWGAT
jgi:type VI secretion system secreted protein VgrG